MSREFGKLMSSALNDPDWLALSDAATVLYGCLCADPDISAAGVLTYVPKRWVKYLDGGAEAVDAAIIELSKASFIAVDTDTLELWIRSFVKHDGKLNHGRWKGSVARAVETIHSPGIRLLAAAAVRGETPGRNVLRFNHDSITIQSEWNHDSITIPSVLVHVPVPVLSAASPKSKTHSVVDDPVGATTDKQRELDIIDLNLWDRFRRTYPKNNGLHAAKRIFQNLDGTNQASAVKALETQWLAHFERIGIQYAQAMDVWLQDRLWEKPPPSAPAEHAPKDYRPERPPWDEMDETERERWAGIPGVDPAA